MSRVYVPSRFRRSPRAEKRRAKRAHVRRGPGADLMLALERGTFAYLFTLSLRDLGLTISDDRRGRFTPKVVEAIHAAVARMFNGPYYAVIEPGEHGRLHVHVIAHRFDGPPDLERDTVRCRWVYDAPGLYAYLNKADPYSPDDEAEYLAARTLSPTGRTPRLRRHRLDSERLMWVGTNVLSLTLARPPDVLPCGRCRYRHLPDCPTYRAAAAAAARNEPTSSLGGHFDGSGFIPDGPPIDPAWAPDLTKFSRPASAAAAKHTRCPIGGFFITRGNTTVMVYILP